MRNENEPSDGTSSSLCAEVEMTPEQCNTILEDKLGHLKPVLECALVTFKRVEETLANGGINWRRLFQRAKSRNSD